MKRNIAVLAAVILLVGVAMYRNFVQADVLPTEQAPKANFLAPEFSLTGLDGKQYTVGGKREKALFINFWASWCGPCELEAPELVKLYDKYQDKLDIYAVNVTTLDNEADAKRFVETYGFQFPVLMDYKNEVTKKYMVLGYPTNFIVDKNGVIQEVLPGLRTPEELERKLRKVM